MKVKDGVGGRNDWKWDMLEMTTEQWIRTFQSFIVVPLVIEEMEGRGGG